MLKNGSVGFMRVNDIFDGGEEVDPIAYAKSYLSPEKFENFMRLRSYVASDEFVEKQSASRLNRASRHEEIRKRYYEFRFRSDEVEK